MYIAVTMGDPAGIGPEIVARSLATDDFEGIEPFVIGDVKVLLSAISVCDLSAKINVIENAEDGIYKKGIINVINIGSVSEENILSGRVCAECGVASFSYIEKAVSICKEGKAAAIATAPINKESLKAAKVSFIGHTEIIAGLLSEEGALTMFETGNMRVFFLSRHKSLKDAVSYVTKENIINVLGKCLKYTDKSLPFAVAALNPHGSDGGRFGTEEKNEIIPAIYHFAEKGFNVVGPVPADSVFDMSKRGLFSGVLSLYHDQGHIACKTVDFFGTISVTLGLSVLRTSVDHGTAFDIAGKGIAAHKSMTSAILAAKRYAEMKNA